MEASSGLTEILEFDNSGNMETNQQSVDTLSALSALAQEHRLAVFRLLVQTGPDGLPAGDIAEKLDIPSSSLSFHLSHLKQGGIVDVERQGRSQIYRADFAAMNRLITYLLENCCAGSDCAGPAVRELMTTGETQ